MTTDQNSTLLNRPGHASRRFQILSLSGGGYRGLYAARVLEQLEAVLQKPIYESFDLLAGTSIGGIIAIALALDKPARTIRDVIERHGPEIFEEKEGWRRWTRNIVLFGKSIFRPKYETTGLRNTIERIIGDSTGLKLEDVKRPLIVPAVALTAGASQIFKSPHHEAHFGQRDTSLHDIALATAAAPIYFPAARIGDADYVDGGLIANSPDLIAVLEAERFLGKQRQHIFMLSVGTTTESAALAGGGTLNRGLADWAAGKKLLDVTMAAQQSLAQQLTKDMLREQYFQINAIQSPSQAKTLALDSATLSATATLKIMADGSVEEAKNDPRLMQFLNHQGLKRAW